VTPSETNCGRTAGEAKNNQIIQLRPCPSGDIREHWPRRLTSRFAAAALVSWITLLGRAAVACHFALRQVEEATHSIRVEHSSFEEWWEPLTFGVGPAGSYVAGLDPALQAQLRERCRAKLPPAPFLLTAHAWAARGLA